MHTPNKTIGSALVYLSGIDWRFKASFSWQWKGSIIPFAVGWYAVVWIYLVPINCTNCCQSWDSTVLLHQLWWWRELQIALSAVISALRIAYGQRVKQSSHVDRYMKPFECENGPTISRWIWSKWTSGVSKVENRVTVCCCIFNLWRCRHVCAHFLMLEFMLGHMNRALTRCCIACIP